MKISIITPTYNSEETIVRNVHSVIKQTFKDFEHIIIDNLSGDKTISLVKEAYKNAGLESKLKIICEKDSGISDAFNKGIINSNGDIIGILNSDDYFFNDQVLEKVVKEFSKSEILFVHGTIFFKDEIYGSNFRKPLLCPIQHAMPYNHPTMFFRKSVYNEYGAFDLTYKYAMDYELICRYEKLIPHFRDRGKFIESEALVVVSAGGESWKNELESIKELKKALHQHHLWNLEALFSYILRFIRIELKYVLVKLKMIRIVYVWRKLKWNRH